MNPADGKSLNMTKSNPDSVKRNLNSNSTYRCSSEEEIEKIGLRNNTIRMAKLAN